MAQAAWYIKARALTLEDWIDDTEIEEEGVADMLLDDNAVAQLPRPGTSLARPSTGAAGGGVASGLRPMSSSGRPVTGFVRPGTQSRGGSLQDAFLGARPGTSRPVTSGGRLVRLGTASMMSQTGGKFVDLDRMDLGKYAQRPALARVLCDYIMQVEHNPKKGAELCALATKQVEFSDWWWKARLGKCYYQLGQLREAEAQFKSSQKQCEVAATIMELCKVYIKMDQPNTALNTYRAALERPVNASSIQLQLGIARIYEMLNDMASGVAHHRKVLQSDSSNIEAIACLASHHFYCDQPEISLHLYKRLIQMGVDNCEIWNNLGLCCFYASQYDMCLQCFEKALLSAEGEEVAEVWYNFGQVAVGIGDLGLAYQAFKVAVSIDGAHAEALNNLGVLETQRKNLDQAKSAFHNAQQSASFLFEPFYNQALLHFKVGDFQESYDMVRRALDACPSHADSQELMKQLQNLFTQL